MISLLRSQSSKIKAWDGTGASAWVEGLGIHTGEISRLRFHRAPGEPIRFLLKGVDVPAHVNSVINTTLATELGRGHARLSTVEHLLAALYVHGHWTGFVIEVEGREVPILDGSASGWAQLLRDVPAEPLPTPIVPPETAVDIRGGYVGIEPAPNVEQPSVSVAIGFAHPAIGEQTWVGQSRHWRALLDARTFGFGRDLERLWAQGRGMGARADNAVIFDDQSPNQPLRGFDEPVRHKALDLLGDLYLLGRPLQGRVYAERASHEAHVALVRNILGC